MRKNKEKLQNEVEMKDEVCMHDENAKTNFENEEQIMDKQYAMKALEEIQQKDDAVEGLKINVGVLKVSESAKLPVYSTLGSRCFDIFCCFDGNIKMKSYYAFDEIEKHAFKMSNIDKWALHVRPGERVLIPTGLIFDIPRGYSMLLRPRSGISTKRGLTLVNCVGVIDWDYREEVFIPIVNVGNAGQTIISGERLCQGEIVKDPDRVDFVLKETIKSNITDRSGGFGSTGTN